MVHDAGLMKKLSNKLKLIKGSVLNMVERQLRKWFSCSLKQFGSPFTIDCVSNVYVK